MKTYRQFQTNISLCNIFCNFLAFPSVYFVSAAISAAARHCFCFSCSCWGVFFCWLCPRWEMRSARGRQIFFYIYSIQFHRRPTDRPTTSVFLRHCPRLWFSYSHIVLIGNPDKFHLANGAESREQSPATLMDPMQVEMLGSPRDLTFARHPDTPNHLLLTILKS